MKKMAQFGLKIFKVGRDNDRVLIKKAGEPTYRLRIWLIMQIR